MAIGVLLSLFAGVFRYVDQHFDDQETFLEQNAELAINADVRERLFGGFLEEITTIADGEVDEQEAPSLLDELLEEDAEEDAAPDPFTQERIERDQVIETVLLDVFDSQAYNTTFLNALQGAHDDLIAATELESTELLRNKGEVFFDMSPLYGPIFQQLSQNELTVEISRTPPPAGYGVFKVADRETTINPVWRALSDGPGWRGLATVGAILSLIGAVAIADRRPSTAIQFGGGMVGVGVVVIVLVYLIRFLVPLLTSGGASGNSVVAVYGVNTAPLVSNMIRLVIFGVILAALGGIARLIWPDDWVYSSVADERGVRSIMRRRGSAEPPAQVVETPQAAAVTVPGYPAYAQPPYPGYGQTWGQPYPGQYPPGYGGGYPAGPYAQPGQPMVAPGQMAQHYNNPGRPTVPVAPVQIEQAPELVPPAAPPHNAGPGDLPADAAQIVPRVVAHPDATLAQDSAAAVSAETDDTTFTDTVSGNGSGPVPAESDTGATSSSTTGDADAPQAAVTSPGTGDTEEGDDWADEHDW